MLIYDAPIVTNEANTITIDMLITHFVNEQQYPMSRGQHFPSYQTLKHPFPQQNLRRKASNQLLQLKFIVFLCYCS